MAKITAVLSLLFLHLLDRVDTQLVYGDGNVVVSYQFGGFPEQGITLAYRPRDHVKCKYSLISIPSPTRFELHNSHGGTITHNQVIYFIPNSCQYHNKKNLTKPLEHFTDSPTSGLVRLAKVIYAQASTYVQAKQARERLSFVDDGNVLTWDNTGR